MRRTLATPLGLALTLGACGDTTGDLDSSAASSIVLSIGLDATPGDTASGDDSGDDSGGPASASASIGEPDTTGESTTSGAASFGEPDTGASGTTDGPPERCAAPVDPLPCDDAADDVFKALGLGCSDDPTLGVPIENAVLKSPDEQVWRVATRFGTAAAPNDPKQPAWAPREGQRFLVIGTGRFPLLKKDGELIEKDDEDSTANDNPDGLEQLPGVMKYQVGSNDGAGGTPFVGCDTVHDCSDTLAPQWDLKPNNRANDVFYMSFRVTTPAGTHGWLLDLAYFSEEWPVYVGTDYNDMLVVWSTSETFTGNVTFIDGQPLTVTGLTDYMTIKPKDPRLAGTGFPGDDEGASTGWLTARASARPGESFTVAISIFDMGDTVWDTVGILDNFRWDCAGCVASEGSCGLEVH